MAVNSIAGVVHNGVVVPQTPLPEGAQVEIRLNEAPALAARFQQLADRWRDETAHLSPIRKKVLHPAYQEIIGMGAPAVPLILAEMKRRPGQWFWALQAITGANPIADEQQGNLGTMTDAWLDWVAQQGQQR